MLCIFQLLCFAYARIYFSWESIEKFLTSSSSCFVKRDGKKEWHFMRCHAFFKQHHLKHIATRWQHFMPRMRDSCAFFYYSKSKRFHCGKFAFLQSMINMIKIDRCEPKKNGERERYEIWRKKQSMNLYDFEIIQVTILKFHWSVQTNRLHLTDENAFYKFKPCVCVCVFFSFDYLANVLHMAHSEISKIVCMNSSHNQALFIYFYSSKVGSMCIIHLFSTHASTFMCIQ